VETKNLALFKIFGIILGMRD